MYTRPRFGARGWKQIRYESGISLTPVTHEPSSASTSAYPPERPTCLGFPSATNQHDDPPLSDEISIGRVTDDESIIGEIETVTSSDVVLRSLSIVATITTHAVSGGDADFPIEIDFERVGHTSIPRNQFLFVVSDGRIVASNNIGVKAQESFKVQKRVWWNGCLELLECPGLAES